MFADRSSSKAAQVIARATAGVVEALEQRTLFSAGDLDLTFGNDGIALDPAELSFDLLHDVSVQSDGKVVAVGSQKDANGREQLLLIRFNANGTPDPTFGTGGRVVTDVGAAAESGRELAIQSDGKIVVTGSIGPDLAVLRYSAEGTLDTTFGGDGIVTVPQVDEGRGLAIQSNGRIVVSGVETNDLYVVRLNSNGQLDNTFGSGDGILETGMRSFMAGDVAVLDNSEILALGSSSVRRLSSTGATLATYTIALDATAITMHEVLVQPDGKIAVAGSARFNDRSWSTEATLVRLTANGQVDTEFGTNGVIREDVGQGSVFNDVIRLGNGDLVAPASRLGVPGQDPLGIIRYNADGSPDTAFDDDGLAQSSILSARSESVAVGPDGKLVVVGHRRFDDVTSAIAVARFTNAGDLDTTFSGDGALVVTPRSVSLHDVLVLSNGKTLAVGTAISDQGNRDFWIARYNVDGSLDTSFGDDGRTLVDFGGVDDIAQAVALQSDGKIIAAGAAGHDFALVRLTAGGQVDESFGDDGIVRTPVGDYGRIHAIVVDANNRIFAAGIAVGDQPSTAEYVVAKYTADGALADGFGDDGVVRTQVNAAIFRHAPEAIAIDGQGRILVVGTVDGESQIHEDIAVLRYLAGGSLDDSFDNNGINRINLRDAVGSATSASNDRGIGLILQDNGRIVIGGEMDDQFLLLGLEEDGSFDRSFGDDGKIVTPVTVGDRSLIDAADLAEQANGKIVLTGTLSHNREDFVTARYTADGQLDTSFGDNGIVITDVSGNDPTLRSQLEEVRAVAIGPDGKIVVAGASENRAALVRYEGDAVSNPGPGPGDSADLIIRGTTGDDEIVIRRDGDRLIVEINGATETHDLADVRDIIVNGRAGADAITVAKGVSIDAILNGGKGADTLKGGSGDDTLNGNTGKDELLGRAGDDALVGGKAGDTLVGGKGADTLTGNTGRDDLFGNSGADSFFAVDSIADRLFGGKGDDSADADIEDLLASIEATRA